MHELRLDIPPLQIVQLAPIRFESSDPAEPFVLGAGGAPANGNVRSGVLAVRRIGAGNGFVDAAGAEVRVVITPFAVLRTASIDGVVVTERVVAIGDPVRTVIQWSVDADADLVLRGFGSRRFAAGETATFSESPLRSDVAHAFRITAGELARAVGAGLHVEPSGPVGPALAWAKARLWQHTRAHTMPTLATSLAALITGQPELTRSRIDTAPADLLPLLAARYAAFTGDIPYAASLRGRLRAATDALVCTPASSDTAAAIRLAALAALERTATDLGAPAYAAQLRADARQVRAGLSGRALDPHAAAMLAALRATEPRTSRWNDTEDVARYAWFTWAALEQGSLSEGLRAWQRLVAEADTPVRGAWPNRFGTLGDDAEAAALFVLTLAHGVLGIEPDAPRHRLRLAPRLGVATDQLEVHRIPCGDASISLSIVGDDSAITLRLVQDTGAIPVTAVLEPLIAGHVSVTFIDGRPAPLDIRAHGEGAVVPVQLVLDRERTLRVERERRD